ncbi:MAG: O-antigen ligase family protein, partial [Minisyncoccia bacterium]
FIVGKAYFFRTIVEIIFVAWIFLAVNDSTYRPKKSWLMILFSVFVLALGVSTIFSPNPYKSFWSDFERMDGYITLLHLFVLFIVMGSVYKEAKNWRGWWKASAFTSAIMCVYAFFQLAGKLNINQGGVRVDGTLGNAAYLATYLLFSFFITLFLFAHEKKMGQRILYGVLGVSQLVVIYYTATRGAILGILGGLVLMAIILAIKGSGKIKKVGISTIVLLVLITGIFFSIRNTSFVSNSPVLSRFSNLSFSEFKTQGRYFVWPMALKGIGDKPVFGWGIESFNYVFNKYYDPRMYNQEPWFDRAHNMFLDWLIAGGIVGGGLFISLCALALWKAVKERDDDPEFTGESASILTALLFAYFFQGLFLFDNIVSYIYFVSVLAYLHARSNTEWPKIENWRPSEGIKKAVPAAFSVALVFSLYFGIWKPIKAGVLVIDALKAEQNQKPREVLDAFKNALALHTLGDAEIREQIISYSQSISQSQDQNIKQEYYALLTTEMDKQLQRSPNDTRYRLLYGSALNQLGLPDQALAQLEIAKESSSRKQAVYFEISRSYIFKRDYAKALENLKIARDLEPNSQEAALNLGMAYLYMGDDAKAYAIFAQIEKTYDLIMSDNLLGVYINLNRWNEVVQILKERAKRNPNDVNNYISLASAYLKLGDKANAISALNVVGSLRPDYKKTADAYIEQIKAGQNPVQ